MAVIISALPDDLARKFVSGCHILHYHRVLDAYGHLSVRYPTQRHLFVMARQVPLALVAAPEDLVQYRVSDASPVDPLMTDGYVERYIHSEIFKKYPEVNAVIHSYSESVIPYGIYGVPLQPCFHMAGFLGATEDTKDLLVRNTRLGAALADCFSDSSSESRSAGYVVVMMRGHGMIVVAANIEECVLRSVYTQQNAAIQTTVLITRAAYSSSKLLADVRFLNDAEAADAAVMTHWSSSRLWKLWVKEVEQAGLYCNRMCEGAQLLAQNC
ncbi:class II aldolase and Adducin N-terminal domain-containing protein [Cadophora sp. MPI-SDFR-AT-0126]|nr:class II aldolase and Adducin N-terminal domain-containing protein [Leotiomycetes sp. MPI-SDFR-AT-0126]